MFCDFPSDFCSSQQVFWFKLCEKTYLRVSGLKAFFSKRHISAPSTDVYRGFDQSSGRNLHKNPVFFSKLSFFGAFSCFFGSLFCWENCYLQATVVCTFHSRKPGASINMFRCEQMGDTLPLMMHTNVCMF